MSDSDFNKIREIAENHTLKPRSEAWQKLDMKLKSKKTKVRMINYRNISIAAILISILSVTAVFSMYLNEHNPQVFASNEEFRPIVLEELSTDIVDDPFFSIENSDILKEAYTKDVVMLFRNIY